MKIEQLKDILSNYARVDVKADVSFLDKSRKEVIKALIEASKGADLIFWRQTSPIALDYLKRYENASTEEERLIYDIIKINGGPYLRLRHFEPILGAPQRPKGGGFYPEDATVEEVEAAAKDDPAILDPYTMVVRENGRLKAIPYHEFFEEETKVITDGLKRAAENAADRSLRTYLLSKIEDLQKDNYFNSDSDWIDLKDPYIDVVIGPYEVYEDELMGVKAAHEAVVMVRSPEQQVIVDRVEAELGDVAQYIWSEASKDIGAAPISVVDSVHRAGDAAVGYQFVAFNLPNDPEVREKKGAKKVLHRNFLDARLQHIIAPVGGALLMPKWHEFITYNGLFDFVLMHENCHSMGPQFVKGTNTPINTALRESYVAIEEAKADTAGMASAVYLMEKGVLDSTAFDQLITTFISAQFRAIRFMGEAHAVAAQISLSWLKEKGILKFSSQGVDFDKDKVPDALRELSQVLMEIQHEGNKERAEAFIREYGVTTGEFKEAVDRIKHLPIELMPTLKVNW